MDEYNKLKKLTTKQLESFKEICTQHFKYITKLNADKKDVIVKYVSGFLMRLKFVQPVATNHNYMQDLLLISHKLDKIIKNTKPLDKNISVFQAQIENKKGKFEIGDKLFRLYPFSTTMYHPVAFEWLIERVGPKIYQSIFNWKLLKYTTKIPVTKKLVLYVYLLPKKSNIGLCVGCPDLPCSKNYSKKIQNDVFREVKKELTAESEIIVSHKQWIIQKIEFMKFSDINNINMYGKGPHNEIAKGKYKKDKSPITIVYLKPYELFK